MGAGQHGHLLPAKVASLLTDSRQGFGEKLAGDVAVLLGQPLGLFFFKAVALMVLVCIRSAEVEAEKPCPLPLPAKP